LTKQGTVGIDGL